MAAVLLQQSDYVLVGFFSWSIQLRKKYKNSLGLVKLNNYNQTKEYKSKKERMFLCGIDIEVKAISAALEHFRYIIRNQIVNIWTDHKLLIGALKNSNHFFLL